jgi:putative membrane protein
MTTPPPGPPQPRPVSDVTRRTRLADERTYLAWIRTALAAFAVSLGAGKVVPALVHVPSWPYEILGVGYALIGLAIVTLGLLRHRTVEAALSRGEDVEIDPRIVAGLAVSIVPLGLVLLGVVIFS